MVSGIGHVPAPLSPQSPRRGEGSAQHTQKGQGAPDPSRRASDQGRRPPGQTGQSREPRGASDEKSGRPGNLQVFRADQVPLKSLRAIQTYGDVASPDRSADVELAGLSIHV